MRKVNISRKDRTSEKSREQIYKIMKLKIQATETH